MTTPVEILRQAIKAVPAVRYALGVAGLAAVVVIVAGFNIDYRIAVFGVVIVLILMTVLVVFAYLVKVAEGISASLAAAALFLVWAAIALVIATASFLFTSYFFSWPRPLENVVANDETNELIASMLANFSDGHYDNADSIADRILVLKPSQYRALNMKGAVAFYRGRYDEAVTYFQRSLVGMPRNKLEYKDIVTRNLGDALVEIGQYQEAKNLYVEESLPRRATDSWQYRFGRVEMHLGNYESCLTYLRKVSSSYEKGKARVLEAACLAGLADSVSDATRRATTAVDAKLVWEKALAIDANYWTALIRGDVEDMHEGFTKARALLRPLLKI